MGSNSLQSGLIFRDSCKSKCLAEADRSQKQRRRITKRSSVGRRWKKAVVEMYVWQISKKVLFWQEQIKVLSSAHNKPASQAIISLSGRPNNREILATGKKKTMWTTTTWMSLGQNGRSLPPSCFAYLPASSPSLPFLIFRCEKRAPAV